MSQKKIVNYFCLFLLVAAMVIAAFLIASQGRDDLQVFVKRLGIWGPLGLFSLRFISVIIPAIPGTVFSVLAGSLFGFWLGLGIICLADLCSCSASFSISRCLGRKIVQKLMGAKSIARMDRLCQTHLENNFFLMTGFLMTGAFDFVAYGIGLTKTSLFKFIPALIISILLSNPPIVAVASNALAADQKLPLIAAAFGIIGIGILTQLLKQRFLTSDG